MAVKHWSKMQERGNYLGIQTLLFTHKILGRKGLWLILFPVVVYLFITGRVARAASKQFLQQVNLYTGTGQSVTLKQQLKHFCSFADSAFDKIDGWLGRISLSDIEYTNEHLFSQLNEQRQGAIFIGSHLGNLEVCRALSQHRSGKVINVLVFTHHAVEFNKMLKKINPNVAVNLIQVTDLGPGLAILLKEKIEQGEIIVIVGDRTSTTTAARSVQVPFLDKPAPFSQGPFILAALLDCPVYFLFCLKDQQSSKYHVIFEQYSNSLKMPRTQRQAILNQVITDYAQRLGHYAAQYPYQWFNFYDFWQNDQQVARDQAKEK
ncbi:MAG: LpxL/LpxP family acyltransferase [Pseudoalteromonas sp.]|uniref:LpxL/LpxP family acyltransferase n=1 Tax=Pseudoalteromonas TaxID=53246 RepID=UPI0015FB387B|nr:MULTISPECIES: acyltransferase [Pseudoalteromonas]MBB1405038.1 acyltransferase [Pseudoalteromonas sp. SG44-5]MBE0420851.1 acyltransferase [Pseudoalteromonas nigrifaciens]MBO7925015.1 acyltransferase [Pseudoalteromonas sp. K222D]